MSDQKKVPDPLLNLNKAPLQQVISNLGNASGVKPDDLMNKVVEIQISQK